METLTDVRDWLQTLDEPCAVRGTWTAGQTLAHCAQSLEFLIDGFPEPRNIVVRRVFGPLVARRFIAKGALSHDIAAPIPGAGALDTDFESGRSALLGAIDRYTTHTGSLHEHFAYGKVTKEQGDRLNVLHLVDHLEETGTTSA